MFNKKFFPNPEFKRQVHKGEVEEEKYGIDKIYSFFRAEIFYYLILLIDKVFLDSMALQIPVLWIVFVVGVI